VRKGNLHRESSLAAALILLLAIVLTASNVQANNLIAVGVHAGDWAEYCFEVSYSTNDPGPMISPWSTWIDVERGRVEILSVIGSIVTYETTLAFTDGNEISDTGSVDLSSGLMDHSPPWPSGPEIRHGLLIAANLSVGDLWINATLMRYCAGAHREVNYFGLMHNRSSGMGWFALEGNFYFDRSSGVFVEEDVKMQYCEENYMTNVSVVSNP